MVLRTLFNLNLMNAINLRTEQVRIHQSMDTTPVVAIINVDPFANQPLPQNNQTSLPRMEFTCVTANFTGPIPVTNYLWVQFVRNSALIKWYFNTIAEMSNDPPTIAVWDSDIWAPNSQEAVGFIQLPVFDVPLCPFDERDDEIVTKRLRLAAGEENPPSGTDPFSDLTPSGCKTAN